MISYTVTKDDFYYVLNYGNSDYFCETPFGYLEINVEKYEYDVSDVNFDAACNTYNSTSCQISIPLGAGRENVLIAVDGVADGKYSIKFRSSNRQWAIAVVVVPPTLLVYVLIVLYFCRVASCYRRHKRRSGYSRM